MTLQADTIASGIAARHLDVQEHKALSERLSLDHEKRIRRLEAHTWKLAGGAGTLGALAGFFLERLL